MNFNNFTIKSQEAVQEAVNLVQSRGDVYKRQLISRGENIFKVNLGKSVVVISLLTFGLYSHTPSLKKSLFPICRIGCILRIG